MNYRIWLMLPMVILTFLVINIYIGWNILQFLAFYHISPWPALYWIVYTLIAMSFIIGKIPRLKGVLKRLMTVVGACYIFIFEYLVFVLPVVNLLIWGLGHTALERSVYFPLISWSAIALLLWLIVRGSYNAWSPVVRTYDIVIAKDVPSLPQLNIVMASDFHLGNIVGRRHLERFKGAIDTLQPDLILLVGDMIDDSIEPFMRHRMYEWFAELQARFGIYAVLGNHEYYGGHRDRYVEQMARINIPVLQDEVVDIEQLFYVVGRKDRTALSFDEGGRLSFSELLADIDLSRPVIVMDHQPNEFAEASAAGADMLLSGHTHRGQFVPNQLFTKRIFELDWGYMLKNNMHVFVSSGFGTWGPPIRIGSRSELLHIKVRFNSSI